MPASDRLRELVASDRWQELPRELAGLAPHFADIGVLKMTRPPSIWKSRYHILKKEAQA